MQQGVEYHPGMKLHHRRDTFRPTSSFILSSRIRLEGKEIININPNPMISKIQVIHVNKMPVKIVLGVYLGSSMKLSLSALSLSALYSSVLSSTRCSRFREYICRRRIRVSM